MLIGLINTNYATPKKTEKNQAAKKEAAIYHIKAQSFESTLTYDGNAYLKIGIFKYNTQLLKVQILAGNTSLMRASYAEQSISEGFNLAQLPKGNYTIKISSGDEIIERNITKNTEALIFE